MIGLGETHGLSSNVQDAGSRTGQREHREGSRIM